MLTILFWDRNNQATKHGLLENHPFTFMFSSCFPITEGFPSFSPVSHDFPMIFHGSWTPSQTQIAQVISSLATRTSGRCSSMARTSSCLRWLIVEKFLTSLSNGYTWCISVVNGAATQLQLRLHLVTSYKIIDVCYSGYNHIACLGSIIVNLRTLPGMQ